MSPPRPLGPRLGSRRLDTITNEQVQQLKRALSAKAAKSVNNVLTVLNVLLKTAVEWAILKQMRARSTPAGTKDIGDVSRLRRLRAARGHGSPLGLADLPHRVAGRRGGITVRRDAGAGMGGCGSHRTTALRPAIRLGRARHRAEGGATTLCATHDSIGEGPSSASAPEQFTGALPARWQPAHSQDGAALDAACDSTREDHGQRRPYAPAHVLFASRHARRPRAGDSGTCRASGSDDDSAVHAPQPGGPLRGPFGSSMPRTPARRVATCWQRNRQSPLTSNSRTS